MSHQSNPGRPGTNDALEQHLLQALRMSDRQFGLTPNPYQQSDGQFGLSPNPYQPPDGHLGFNPTPYPLPDGHVGSNPNPYQLPDGHLGSNPNPYRLPDGHLGSNPNPYQRPDGHLHPYQQPFGLGAVPAATPYTLYTPASHARQQHPAAGKPPPANTPLSSQTRQPHRSRGGIAPVPAAAGSQVGAMDGQYNVPPASSSARPPLDHAPAAPRPSASAREVKVLVSHGGAFKRTHSSGNWGYVGGHVTDVTVDRDSDFDELKAHLMSSVGYRQQQRCVIKYELPGSKDLLVDLVMDEDLINMWDELDDFISVHDPNYKLRLQLQCLPDNSRGPQSQPARPPSAIPHSPGASSPLELPPRSPQPLAWGSSADGAGSGGRGAHPDHQEEAWGRRTAVQAVAQRLEGVIAAKRRVVLRPGLQDIIPKMQLIPAEELRMERCLGGGSYGEVYLGKWLGADVVIKVLRPEIFSPAFWPDYTEDQVMAELVLEANSLAALHHPSIVQCHGIVLSSMEEAEAGADAAAGAAPGVDAWGGSFSKPDGSSSTETAPRISHSRANSASDPAGMGWAGLSEEAMMAAAASPGGLPVVDQPVTRRGPALVVEFLAGRSVRGSFLRKAEYMNNAFLKVQLILDAAKGIEYLHSKGVVHGDLKWGNLIVGFRDNQPRCKVADYGFGRIKQRAVIAELMSLKGTLPWMAPEVVRSPSASSFQADVYSFGVVMWALWTGREPFEGLAYTELRQLLSSHSGVRPPLPGGSGWQGESFPEPAPGFSDLLQRCWQESPSKRPSFVVIVSELESMLAAVRTTSTE